MEFATPANTMGMGNPSAESGDTFTPKEKPKKKKKNLKPLKDYIKEK